MCKGYGNIVLAVVLPLIEFARLIKESRIMCKDGKILILKLHDKLLSLLLSGNQILSARAQHAKTIAVGDIYIGKVQNISRNINAAFIDLGDKYLTFLPMADAAGAFVVNRKPDGTLKPGDEILVQVAKEPMKTKLAGVTTRISLSGRYAVIGTRCSEKNTVQVSSKLSKKLQNRFRSQEALQTLSERYQVIVRTNAGTLTEDAPLLAEAKKLAETLTHILEIADKRTCYSCLYRSQPDYITFIQNAYRTEYDEIVTDLPDVYGTLQEFFRDTDIPIRLYEDNRLPLYKLYSVEMRIQELLDKKVWLKSGGYLVIEPTEALISIDVNTGKCETGKNAEETFLKINREAAEMIALQLRARNLSGMILIDFINLNQKDHEIQLMEYMRKLLRQDPVTANVVDMTGLGLMELTRKKVDSSFAEQMRKEN